MSLTDYFIVLFIALFMMYAIYDELITARRRGDTRLRVPLKRRNGLDSAIFTGLIAVLIYRNITSQGTQVTTTLLMVLAFFSVYLFWLRQPKLLFKAEGFFYGPVFIEYQRIQSMNLSEDGVLVIQLEQRPLHVHVSKLDDLESIYHFMVRQHLADT